MTFAIMTGTANLLTALATLWLLFVVMLIVWDMLRWRLRIARILPPVRSPDGEPTGP